MEQVFEEVPEEAAMLFGNLELIRPEQANIVLSKCGQQTQNANFGLQLAKRIAVSDYGIYTYLLRNAGTVDEFLSFTERYYPVFYRGAYMRYYADRDSCRLEFVSEAAPLIEHRHVTEWALGFHVNFIRKQIGVHWNPIRATFTHSASVDLKELSAIFGPNLMFDSSANCIELDINCIHTEIQHSDRKLGQILANQADELLRSYVGDNDFADRVRLLIMRRQMDGGATLANVSQDLHISTTTLKRRLSKQGHRFRSLRDQVIKNVATNALKYTDASSTRIASMLGYSEVSAFNHAFSRLFGTTPGDYRRQLVERDTEYPNQGQEW